MGMLVGKRGVFRHIVGAWLFWGNWNRLHHWPTWTWSKVNRAVFFLLFKERFSNMCLWAGPQHTYTLPITHSDAHGAVAHIYAKSEKIEGLLCKRFLLCRLHKYKNAYMSYWIVIACIRIMLPLLARVCERSGASISPPRSEHLIITPLQLSSAPGSPFPTPAPPLRHI